MNLIVTLLSLLSFSLPALSSPKTQHVQCLGLYQQANLTIRGYKAQLAVNNEGQKSMHSLKQVTSRNQRHSTTFSSRTAKVTIPNSWIGKKIKRLTKYDRHGFEITELTNFAIGSQRLAISECSSEIE